MPKQRRSVLIAGLNFSPEQTGIAPYTTALARRLSERGASVSVLTTHPHYPEWKLREGYGQWRLRENFGGVSVQRLMHFIPSPPTGIRRVWSEVSFGLRVAFSRWGHPEVVLAVSPALISSIIVRVRAMITSRKTPFVVWVQDLYSLGLRETKQGGTVVSRLMQLGEGWLLRHSAQVIVIHDRFAEIVVQEFGVQPDRVRVIRNWTHLARREGTTRTAARRLLAWDETIPIALHAGNMGAKQGLSNIVRAAKLAEKGAHNVMFVLLGDGSERQALEVEAAGCSAIRFVDPVGEEGFHAALQAADILLLNERPGVSEMAVPSKLTSYFAAGRPIIAATDLDGVSAEEVRAAGAGTVVRSGQPAQLLEAVEDLLGKPEERTAYSISGSAYVTTVLQEETAIQQFVEALDFVVSASNR